MEKKKILYFTTNNKWGGSEILWTQSAKKMIEEGYDVKAFARYDYKILDQYIQNEQRFFDLKNRYSSPGFIQRLLYKFSIIKNIQVDLLEKTVKNFKPSISIISQGNNIDGYEFMKLCYNNNIPFVTITHLVTEHLWPSLDDEKIYKLRDLFDKSVINYFVSKHTMHAHEKLLGYTSKNSGIIYNPFTKNDTKPISFPGVTNGVYKIALLGRLEIFHKGYDLLIEVIKNEKWKQRSILFTIYGSGPHVEILKRLIDIAQIENLTIESHVEDISTIWEEHHLLMMPSRMEGQSLTLTEAMRFKRAAVVTNVGGVEELIEDGISGFIADYPSVNAIDDALERAWENRSLWESMGKNAYHSIMQKHPEDATSHFNQELFELLK